MKTAIIMPVAEQRGGGELMLLHLMQQGQSMGAEWLVIFLQNGPMVGQVLALGAEACVISAGRLREPHRYPITVRRIARAVKENRCDAVVGWMSYAHLYGTFAGVPALWYQLGIPLNKGWLDRIATRLPARGIIACSQAGADAQANLKPARPLRVVYPGVELERFDPAILPTPAEAKKRLGLPAEGPIIGIVGRLQRWKGMHVLVEAMPKVLAQYPNAHCVIVGGDHALEVDYPTFVKGRIAALGLQKQVTLAGLQKNVPEWMQAMDIIVHASDHEPFGIVIIEAMALGKPVIAGDAAGPTEIITNGVDGFLTPYGNSEVLAAAILRYLNDPALAERMGLAAQKRAQDFSAKSYATNFIQTIQELLSGKSP